MKLTKRRLTNPESRSRLPFLRARHAHEHDHHVRFDLLDDDADPAAVVPVSPEIKRACKRSPSSRKTARGYKIDGDRSGVFSLFGRGEPGPAGWLYMKWRAGVSAVLKVLRWVDTWAYLISIPFIILMILGIAVENRAICSHRGRRGRSGELRAILGRLARVLRPAVQGWVRSRAWRFCFRPTRSITWPLAGTR